MNDKYEWHGARQDLGDVQRQLDASRRNDYKLGHRASIGDIIRAAGHDPNDPHTQMPKLTELAQQMIDMPKWVLEYDATPLPSEPGTWWLDVDGYMWTVDVHGSLFRPGSMSPNPQNYSPFRQLVLK